MHDHYLVLYPNGESVRERICELISYAFDNACELLLSLLTNQSHLERLLQKPSVEHSATHLSQIEKYLRRKGYIELNYPRKHSEDELLRLNRVNVDGDYGDHLKGRLARILSVFEAYDNLKTEVEDLRCQKFSEDDDSHQVLLKDLWTNWMPDNYNYSRVGKHWRDIGFQGDDPSTDFRGMGMLSLHQLVYFSKKYPEAAQAVLTLSNHPVYGFPMAIAGITITSLARHLLIVGRLKKHFYNTNHEEALTMDSFHEVYCRIFILFCEYWKRAEPDSVMSFNLIRLQFERSLADLLQKDDVTMQKLVITDMQ